MKRKEKVKEYKRMGKEGLAKEVTDKQEHLRALRFDLIGGKVKNVREIRETRRDIARIKTILKHA